MILKIGSSYNTQANRINFENKRPLTGKLKSDDLNNIKRMLNFIQEKIEISTPDLRLEMQTALHIITNKEELPVEIRQQAKDLLLKSYM